VLWRKAGIILSNYAPRRILCRRRIPSSRRQGTWTYSVPGHGRTMAWLEFGRIE
jgi:hypothetical protein